MDDKRHDYHYSRDERLGLPGAPRRRDRGKGIFRRNRGLLILLIDVLIIAAIAIGYRQFLYQPPYRAEIAGYDVVLRGFALEDRVVVQLRVEPGGGGEPTAGADRVFAVFRAGDGEIRLSEPLEASGGASLSGSILTPVPAREVQADVRIGGEVVTLRRELDEP